MLYQSSMLSFSTPKDKNTAISQSNLNCRRYRLNSSRSERPFAPTQTVAISISFDIKQNVASYTKLKMGSYTGDL